MPVLACMVLSVLKPDSYYVLSVSWGLDGRLVRPGFVRLLKLRLSFTASLLECLDTLITG